MAKTAARCLEILLSKDKGQRESVDQVLAQDWLSGAAKQDDVNVDCELPSAHRWRRHARRSWLHRELRLAVVTRAETRALLTEQDKYAALAAGGAGRLRRDWAVPWLVKHLNFSERDAQKLFEQLDTDGDGELDVDEFAAMAVDVKQLPESSFQLAFQAIDLDGDGWVSPDDLIRFGREAGGLGRDLSEEDLKLATRELDEDADGAISYDEFKRFLNVGEGSSPSGSTPYGVSPYGLSPCGATSFRRAASRPFCMEDPASGGATPKPAKAGGAPATKRANTFVPPPRPAEAEQALPEASPRKSVAAAAHAKRLRDMVPLLAFRQIGGGTPFGEAELAQVLDLPPDRAAAALVELGCDADGLVGAAEFARWFHLSSPLLPAPARLHQPAFAQKARSVVGRGAMPGSRPPPASPSASVTATPRSSPTGSPRRGSITGSPRHSGSTAVPRRSITTRRNPADARGPIDGAAAALAAPPARRGQDARIEQALARLVNERYVGKPREAFRHMCGVSTGGTLLPQVLADGLGRGIASRLHIQQAFKAYEQRGNGGIGLSAFLQMYQCGCV